MPPRLSRVSKLDRDLGKKDAPVGSRDWALWFVGQALLLRRQFNLDAELLRSVLKKLERFRGADALGYQSFDTLCIERLDLQPEELQAIRGAKAGVTLGAALQLGKHGGSRRRSAGEHGYIVTLPRGNNSAYLRARLQRDAATNPEIREIFEQLEQGRLKSVYAAAVEAGILKPRSPLTKAQQAYKRLTEAERRDFHAWLITQDGS